MVKESQYTYKMEQSQERQTNIIRRICVGPDYLKSMKYTVGASQLRGTCTIAEINRTGPDVFEILIRNSDSEVISWKTIEGMPVVVENNLDLF